jgi:phosphoglycolate phosphatase
MTPPKQGLDLLFDLDGTLTDPLLGIGRCIQHAMVCLGQPPPADGELGRFVGPPLRGTFAELLATSDDEQIERAVTHYRERFGAVGMFENVVYADVAAGLADLAATGHRLRVVTSKPAVYARRIVDHFDLRRWFLDVHGSELDGRNVDKGDLIAVVLEQACISANSAWMIGDRAQDLRGGRRHRLRTAGVLWGYGSEAELRAEDPDLLVGSMPELVAALCREGARWGSSRPVGG